MRLIQKLIHQKPKKLIILIYNLFRMGLLCIFHPNLAHVSLVQNIHPTTEIAIRNGWLELGNSIFTRRYVSFRLESGRLKIGTSFFNQGCSITVMKNIEIGNGCLFGPNVVIVDHDHDYKFTNELRGNHYISDDVIIGNNVWVGANAVIMRGTVIEDNVVIGAGTIVKGHISKNTVVYSQRNIFTKTITSIN